MKTRSLLDTGPLVALLDARDQWAAWSREAVLGFGGPFYTCEAVITEAHFLLSSRTHDGSHRLNELLARGKLEIAFSVPDHQDEVIELMRRYENVPMSFADACLVRMGDLAPSRVITTDGGFQRYRGLSGKRLAIVSP